MSELTRTKEQQDIIDYPSSLVAIARPGSGKTFVMAQKIRAIVPALKEHQGVIAISYTHKASNELRTRARRDGFEIKQSFFGTIDRFCDLEVILPFLPHLWGRPRNEIAIVRIRDLDNAEREQFNDIEENAVSLAVLESHLGIVRSLFQKGKMLLEMNGALALYTLMHSSACQKYLTARYTHIFVDEYQDSGLEQHELFLAIQRLGLVAIAVGDADQSIFGFSGKDSRYLTTLAQNALFKVFPITFNHRCHPSIINYSLRLLSAQSTQIATDSKNVFLAEIKGTQADIARFIDKAAKLLAAKFDVSKASEIAVLVRTSNSGGVVDKAMQSKHRLFTPHPLEEEFGIWSKLFFRLLSFYFNDKVTSQEIIDEFRKYAMTSQEAKMCRAAMRGLRKSSTPTVKDLVSIAEILSPTSESRTAVDLLQESLSDPNLATAFSEPSEDAIQVMSIHKAKGLEFDIVFHLDLHEWILPSKQPGPDSDFNNCVFPNLDEDVHLHYVGITRARKCCILCCSSQRLNKDGEIKVAKHSEFLDRNRLSSLRRPFLELLKPQQ